MSVPWKDRMRKSSKRRKKINFWGGWFATNHTIRFCKSRGDWPLGTAFQSVGKQPLSETMIKLWTSLPKSSRKSQNSDTFSLHRRLFWITATRRVVMLPFVATVRRLRRLPVHWISQSSDFIWDVSRLFLHHLLVFAVDGLRVSGRDLLAPELERGC